MQAGTTSPRPRFFDYVLWLLLLAGLALLVLLLLSFALETKPRSQAGNFAGGDPGQVAYFEFGPSADTLWLANAEDPSRRERLLTAPHAREYGVVPSMAPDGRVLAYAALPKRNPSPSPDAPAELWLIEVSHGADPQLLAPSVDLRVPAVWSPDGAGLVYRRSDAAGFALLTRPAAGGDERVLAESDGATALFPVAFTPDGSRFYFVALSDAGSRLFAVDVHSGEESEVAELAPGITREWSLSKDGQRLAFLAMTFASGSVSARAHVLDVDSGESTAVTTATETAFGPVWAADGSLLVGTVDPRGGATLVRHDGRSATRLAGPARGFDVPLGFGRDGRSYLVRSFSSASAVAPGAATLTVIDVDGERRVVAGGDVTFAGWSAP